MKIGEQVRFVQPLIEGPVVDVQWNKEAAEPEVLVQFSADQQRWFLASQLELVPTEG